VGIFLFRKSDIRREGHRGREGDIRGKKDREEGSMT